MKVFKQLETPLFREKITRRAFLAKSSVLGLTALAATSVPNVPTFAATPKKGGRFRAGVNDFNTGDSLEPAKLISFGGFFINWQLRNNLVEVDHQGKAVPELAETMEPSPDASVWTFRLRKGVEFHNGKSLEARDVIHSMNHHRGERSKSAAKVLTDQIRHIRAGDRHTVIFELTGGNVDFPYILSYHHMGISPAETAGEQWNKGIGTGGYILKRFEPGVRALAVRNPNYWKEGRAHFDEIETIGIQDMNARTSALKAGQIDWMNRCDLKTAHLMEKAKGVQIVRYPGTFHYTLPMFTDIPPYDNNDVRLALKYAIDREQILRTVLMGYGTVGNDHPISPIQRFYSTDLPQRKYDPDRAKFHMKKAGLQNHTFRLHTSTFNGFVDHALLYKEHAAKAGIDIELVHEPADGYWANVWLKKPWLSSSWLGRIPADLMFSLVYKSDAAWNDTHFRHKRFDKLLREARAELDEGKRREMYDACQRIIRDEGGPIIYAFKDNVEAIGNNIRYATLSGIYDGDGARAAERWWFDS